MTEETMSMIENAFRAGFACGRNHGEDYGGDYNEEDYKRTEDAIRDGFAKWLKWIRVIGT